MESSLHSYCDSISGSDYDPISFQQSKKLYRIMQKARKEGDRKTYLSCRDKLVNSVLRLIFKEAAKFQHSNVALTDLIAEANLAVSIGIDQWAPRRGRLSTFVVYTVRNALIGCLEQGYNDVQSVLRLTTRSKQQVVAIQSMPTASVDEISKQKNIMKYRVFAFLPLARLGLVPEHLVEDRETIPNPYEDIDVEDLMKCLPDEDIDFLKRRFGFNGYKSHTFEQLGDLHPKLGKGRSNSLKKYYCRKHLNFVLEKLRTEIKEKMEEQNV